MTANPRPAQGPTIGDLARRSAGETAIADATAAPGTAVASAFARLLSYVDRSG